MQVVGLSQQSHYSHTLEELSGKYEGELVTRSCLSSSSKAITFPLVELLVVMRIASKSRMPGPSAFADHHSNVAGRMRLLKLH